MHAILDKYDVGYCKLQSDVDNLYCFTLRNLDALKAQMIDVDPMPFAQTVNQLIKIVDASSTNDKEFAREMLRYADAFRDFAKEIKLSKRKTKSITTYFTKAIYHDVL